MSRDYRSLRDPNAEYTTRDLSAEAMGATAPRGPRDVERSRVVYSVFGSRSDR